MHQKQPVANVAVSRFSLPVIFSATEELVSEFVSDIDLFGFSRCAQEGEKKIKDKTLTIIPSTGVNVSIVRLLIPGAIWCKLEQIYGQSW